jgi:outer membrane protein assembly factor BamB
MPSRRPFAPRASATDAPRVGAASEAAHPSRPSPAPREVAQRTAAASRRAARRLGPLALAALLTLVLAASGCGDVVPPRGWPAPVLTGSTNGEQLVVIQSSPGKLTQFALTPAGVAERWTFPGDDDDQRLVAIYATPLVREGRLIVAAFSGDVLALDLASGRPVAGWGGKVSGPVVADPVLTGREHMFVATDHGAVHPVDLTSGTIFDSKVDEAGPVYGQGALTSSAVVYGALDKRLFALDSTSGALAWETEAAPLLSGVAPARDMLIAGTLDERVSAYSSSDGAQRWQFTGHEWFWSTPLVSGDTVYAVDLDGRAYALDAASGVERWRSERLRGDVRAAPVLAGGVLVFSTSNGDVFGLDPGTGADLWSARAPSGRLLAAPLVLESGILFVTDGGALLRVQPAGGALEVLRPPK